MVFAAKRMRAKFDHWFREYRFGVCCVGIGHYDRNCHCWYRVALGEEEQGETKVSLRPTANQEDEELFIFPKMTMKKY